MTHRLSPIIIGIFVIVVIHLAMMRPPHKKIVVHQHETPKVLDTNLDYKLEVDPWGWYPKDHNQYDHFFRRHRAYT